MKKFLSVILVAALAASFASCANNSAATTSSTESSTASASSSASESSSSSEEVSSDESSSSSEAEEPEVVVVSALDANGDAVDVEVPYKPERVVVLDLANLDILDNLGLGDCIVGAPTITLDYLQAYEEDDSIPTVGTVKTPDMEAVMACEPDLILMGGRMAEYYDSLCEIAPVVRLTTDADLGLVESVRKNATTVGSIFGEGEQVDALLAQYDERIAALAGLAEGKTALLGMCTSGSFNLLGNDGRCSLIVNEIGFNNIGADAATSSSSSGRGNGGGSGEGSGEGSGHGGRGEGSGESNGRGGQGGSEGSESSGGSTPTHGNEASFELVVDLNADYIFVMDRDAAIGTNGAQMAQEVMENELVMKTDAYQNGNLVILEHPGIWYLAEGGITSLGVMLDDLEAALLK